MDMSNVGDIQWEPGFTNTSMSKMCLDCAKLCLTGRVYYPTKDPNPFRSWEVIVYWACLNIGLGFLENSYFLNKIYLLIINVVYIKVDSQQRIAWLTYYLSQSLYIFFVITFLSTSWNSQVFHSLFANTFSCKVPKNTRQNMRNILRTTQWRALKEHWRFIAFIIYTFHIGKTED